MQDRIKGHVRYDEQPGFVSTLFCTAAISLAERFAERSALRMPDNDDNAVQLGLIIRHVDRPAGQPRSP